VNLPVITDSSDPAARVQQGLARRHHARPPRIGVRSYLKNTAIRSYSLPTLNSDFLYVNPAAGFLTTAAHRAALLEAVNVQSIYKACSPGGPRSQPRLTRRT